MIENGSPPPGSMVLRKIIAVLEIVDPQARCPHTWTTLFIRTTFLCFRYSVIGLPIYPG